MGGRADGYYPLGMRAKEAARYDLAWSSRAHVGPDYWSIEFAVPWQSLNLPDRPTHDIGFTICRERYPVNEYPSWCGWFHRPKTWGVLKGIRVDRKASPVFHHGLDIGEGLWGTNEFSMHLLNVTTQSGLALEAALWADGRCLDTRRVDVPVDRRMVTVRGSYRVPVGLRPAKGFVLRTGLIGLDGKAATVPLIAKKFRVRSETIAKLSLGGGAVYFGGETDAPLRVECFLSQLTLAGGLALSVDVVDRQGRVVYSRAGLKFAARTHSHSIPLRNWPEAWYEVRAAVTRKEGTKQRALSEAILAMRKVRGPFD